jgi:TM2 domain-containing membrane protein YozV
MAEFQRKGEDEIFCSSCGAVIKKGVKFCPNCGKSPSAVSSTEEHYANTVSLSDIREQREQHWMITLLLCIFLGGIGVHRFYVGKIGTAILMILTLGGLGIWWLIDLITIIVGKFRDKNGNYITYGPANTR